MLKDSVKSLDNFAVGQRIQDARIKKEIKAVDMAVALDMSKDQYSRIENGRSVCSTQKLYQIAQYLEVSADYLLFGEEQTGIIAQISELLKNRNKNELETIKRVVEAIYP